MLSCLDAQFYAKEFDEDAVRVNQWFAQAESIGFTTHKEVGRDVDGTTSARAHTHARTHAHTHTHTHTQTHTHTHTHTHTTHAPMHIYTHAHIHPRHNLLVHVAQTPL